METARDDPAAEDAPPPAPAYCRQCGYSLRGLQSGKCPECGGAVDLSNPNTFARRPPRSRLRRWAWRGSVLLVLLALAAASVPGWYYWEWRKEQPALAELRGLGAEVKTKPVEPAWPGRWLPARWAFLHDRAWSVDLQDRTAGEVEGVDLAALAHVEALRLSNCGVTDAALARLGRLASLRGLDVSLSPLDGSGLAPLAARRRLEVLDLHETRLDDAALAHIARFPAATYLDVSRTRVTDAGLAALDGLAALRYLNVSDTAVKLGGLRRLRGLKALRVIEASGVPMTDDEPRDLRALMPNVRINR